MPTLSTHDPHRYAVRSPSQSGGPRKVRPSASLPPLAITREASFLQMTASSASTAQYGHANTTSATFISSVSWQIAKLCIEVITYQYTDASSVRDNRRATICNVRSVSPFFSRVFPDAAESPRHDDRCQRQFSVHSMLRASGQT